MPGATSTTLPTLRLERRLLKDGYSTVAGVDEVGRGSLAGPLVAAAVILPVGARSLRPALVDLRDSKQLTARQRSALFESIMRNAIAIGIGWASHHAVDRDGLTAANRTAMTRAVQSLSIQPDVLIVDAVALPESPIPFRAIFKADSLSLSVAAASVIAKVFRDRWMVRCDNRFPLYGFARHKGYGTREHLDALNRYGPCHLHRRSFSPVLLRCR